jgi:peptidoglycan pentaglycine glycine transferase (the first glycine)
MTIKLLACDDREKFNAFVASSPYGHIHQTFEWGEIKARSGWTPLRFLAEQDGRVVAAVSLLKTTRRGIPVLYASRGPIVDYANAGLAAEVLAKLGDVARRENVLFLRVSPAVPKSDATTLGVLESGGFLRARKPLQHTSTTCLSLAGRSAAELLGSFHEKTRYNIRLAAKNGVEVRKGSEADIGTLHALLLKTGERQSVETFPPEFFADVFRALAPKGMASVYLAYCGAEPAGAIFILRFAGKAWYMWGGFDYLYRQKMPSYAAHWAAIQDCLADGLSVYDFQGMPENPTPKDPLWGIYNFKKGFRGDMIQWIGEWDLPTRLAPLYRAANRLGVV